MVKAKDENVVKTELIIKKKVAKDAISALKQLNEKYSESKSKKPLFDDNAESPVFLQVTLKKIPPKKMKSMIKVQLPHSLLTNTAEVCLITGDLDKRDQKAEIEPTILHYKELLKKQGVSGITEVVPLRQLRTEYKTFESKRQLSAAYDMFLNDKKITGVLPKLLGNSFYDKRKFPIQINLDAANLKEQVERAVSETVFSVSCCGNSCTSEIARLSMDDKEILENILACVKSLEVNIPGQGINILGIYIKTPKSKAIPIYMSFDDPNELKIKAPRRHENVKAEELSTVKSASVKVYKDGRIIVKNIPCSEDENSADEADVSVKSRIKRKKTSKQEAESNEEESPNVNEDIEIDDNEKQPKSKKRKIKNENNLVEESSIMVEDVKPKIKRKKSSKHKQEEELNDEESQDINEEVEIDDNKKQTKSKKRKIKNESNLVEEISTTVVDVKCRIRKKTSKQEQELTAEESQNIKEETEINANEKHPKSKKRKIENNLVEENSIAVEDVKLKIKRKKSSKQEVESNDEKGQDIEETSLDTNEKQSKYKKRMVKKENNLAEEENSISAKDVMPKSKRTGKKLKEVEAECEGRQETQDKQEADSNTDKKRSKRNKGAKKEVVVSNQNEEESKVDIKSSVQKKSKKRIPFNQIIDAQVM